MSPNARRRARPAWLAGISRPSWPTWLRPGVALRTVVGVRRIGGRRPLLPRPSAAMLFLARPYLRLHLALYIHEMEHAAFPRDEHRHERVIPGPEPERALFLGDIGVAGYGVLLPGMAMPAQVATRRAAVTGRGVEWEAIAAYDMTARKAASAVVGRAGRIDLAVVSLGIPDVLVATSADAWERDLRRIIDRIRAEAGDRCRIVLTGIPPMDRFQPIPAIARQILHAQVARLNAVTSRLHHPERGILWAPFPDITTGRMHIRHSFSFRAMHALWAEGIAPYLGDARPTRD